MFGQAERQRSETRTDFQDDVALVEVRRRHDPAHGVGARA
jgi:hypothetical protein